MNNTSSPVQSLSAGMHGCFLSVLLPSLFTIHSVGLNCSVRIFKYDGDDDNSIAGLISFSDKAAEAGLPQIFEKGRTTMEDLKK